MALGFFEPQKGQTATGIAQSRALAAALLRNSKAPANIGEGLNAIGDSILYRSLISDADASEKAGTDAFSNTFNSLIAPYSGAPSSGGVAAALSSSGPSSVPQTADANAIREGLISRGLPSNVADAFVVNFQDESGLNPGINEAAPIVPGSRGGFGLAQWTGPRRVALEDFASQRGVAPSDTNTQLDFLVNELKGSEAGAAKSILGAKDTAGAAQAIVNNFLRPAEQHRAERANRYASLGGDVSPQAMAPELPPPTTISASPAVAEAAPLAAPQQVAQNFQPQQIDPRLIEAANSPFATPGQKAILGGIIQQQQARNELLMKQQMQQSDPAYQLELKTKELQYKNLQNKTSEDSFTNVGDGYLFNNRTKEFIRAPQNAAAGGNLFQGNALDAQALNKLVENGSITQDQALNIAAGKVAPDPNTGALTFFPASALVGGGAQNQPYVDLFGNGGAAPQQQVPGGNGSIPLTGNRAPTEGQANAAGFADRLAAANNVINQLEASGTDKEQALKSSIPLIGNYLTDENFQSYDRAKRDFINAQLRRESGAAIGKDEYTSADKQYFPQPGDSAQVLKDKAQARALAIQGMTRSAGPSYTAPKQEVVSDDIRAARDAIKAGAPRDKVIERLQAAGIDTTGL